MRKLKTRTSVPPGGWAYHVPETGADLKAHDFNSLVTLVSKHLTVNEISLEMMEDVTLGDVIEDSICSSINPSLSRKTTSSGQYLSKKRSRAVSSANKRLGKSVLQRTTGLIIYAKRNGLFKLVAPEKVLERAIRCVTDPLMQPNRGCYSCRDKNVIDQVMGMKLHCDLDPELHTCGVLSVYMRPVIHLDIEALKPHFGKIRIADLDDGFWLKPELIKEKA